MKKIFADEVRYSAGKLSIKWKKRQTMQRDFQIALCDDDGTLFNSRQALTVAYRRAVYFLLGGIEISDQEWQVRFLPYVDHHLPWNATCKAILKTLGQEQVRMPRGTTEEIIQVYTEICAWMFSSRSLKVETIEPVMEFMQIQNWGRIPSTQITTLNPMISRAILEQINLKWLTRSIAGPEFGFKWAPEQKPYHIFNGQKAVALENTTEGAIAAYVNGIPSIVACISSEEDLDSLDSWLRLLPEMPDSCLTVIPDWKCLVPYK